LVLTLRSIAKAAQVFYVLNFSLRETRDLTCVPSLFFKMCPWQKICHADLADYIKGILSSYLYRMNLK